MLETLAATVLGRVQAPAHSRPACGNMERPRRAPPMVRAHMIANMAIPAATGAVAWIANTHVFSLSRPAYVCNYSSCARHSYQLRMAWSLAYTLPGKKSMPEHAHLGPRPERSALSLNRPRVLAYPLARACVASATLSGTEPHRPASCM